MKTALLALVLLALIWSGIGPVDRFTWWLEVGPILIGVPLLLATARRFPLTPLLACLFALHALVLAIGGHSTYAQVPIGFEIRDLLGLERNPWDRIGHLFQGFVPAIFARELLVRTSPIGRSRWLPFLCVACCLAFSAFYELLEWWAAVATGAAADAFLGTQGDPWDTQWDMFLCLVGAVAALICLSGLHQRQITDSGGIS